jgi:hypothetical protein
MRHKTITPEIEFVSYSGVVVLVAGLLIAFCSTLLQLSFLDSFLVGVFGMIVASLGAYLRRLARRLAQPTLSAALCDDKRAPVLWLRAFAHDNLKTKPPSKMHTFIERDAPTLESRLVPILERIGPVIALGKPGEHIAPLGASRDIIPHDRWQSCVRHYISRSQLVVVLMDFSASLVWEMREALASCRHHDGTSTGPSVLLLPLPKRSIEWLHLYGRLCHELVYDLRMELPQVTALTAGILVMPQGSPRAIHAASEDANDKLRTLEAAIAEFHASQSL